MLALETYTDTVCGPGSRIVLTEPRKVERLWKATRSLGGLEGGGHSRWFRTRREARAYLASLGPLDESWGEERYITSYYLVPIEALRSLFPQCGLWVDEKSAMLMAVHGNAHFTVRDGKLLFCGTRGPTLPRPQ